MMQWRTREQDPSADQLCSCSLPMANIRQQDQSYESFYIVTASLKCPITFFFFFFQIFLIPSLYRYVSIHR